MNEKIDGVGLGEVKVLYQDENDDNDIDDSRSWALRHKQKVQQQKKLDAEKRARELDELDRQASSSASAYTSGILHIQML